MTTATKPLPRWVERDGKVGTHCAVCHRYLAGEPPQTCADCKAEKRARRNARKALRAVTG